MESIVYLVPRKVPGTQYMSIDLMNIIVIEHLDEAASRLIITQLKCNKRYTIKEAESTFKKLILIKTKIVDH